MAITRSVSNVAEIARLLGHGGVIVRPTRTGSKWVADCACGWRGTGHVRQVEAIGQGRYHVASAVRDVERAARAAGISFAQALSDTALSDSQLQQLDDVIHQRMEEHAASN